jgi:ABC-type bacteriocin/lantibiotic exporter with double-glycine peptidase domain
MSIQRSLYQQRRKYLLFPGSSPFEEFEVGFTGILLMLELGGQFERRASARPIFVMDVLRSLPHMYGIVAQIISTSLLLQIFGLGTPL